MKSKIAQRILEETPKEIQLYVGEYADTVMLASQTQKDDNEKDMSKYRVELNMNSQLELFKELNGLVGENAWIVAKQCCLEQITYEQACRMVLSKEELDNDIEYFNSICH